MDKGNINNKKLLTIEDLVKFCEAKQLANFNSNESGYQLCVQIPASLTFEEDNDLNNSGMLYCKLRVCHTNLNRNKSFISEENMKKALPSLKYRPLLAHIHQLDDGTWDFHSHDMNITDEGIEYIEKQVGAFTADEPYLEYDKEKDKTYVIAYAAVPEDYTMAADIIRRKGGTTVSCELSIEDMSFNAKEGYLELNDFYFSGCACLGSETDGTEVQPGMEGARLDIIDFSQENNSMFANCTNDLNNKLIETLEKLESTLSNISKFNIDDSKESDETYERREIEVENQEILVNEEIAEIEEVTEEVVTNSEETEEVTETEEVVEEVEETVEESTEEEETEAEESDTPAEDETPEVVEEYSEETEEVTKTEEAVETEETVKEYALVEKNFEIDGKKFSVSFELSHDDIRYGLYNLLSVYDDLDNEWYGIRAVYNDYFVMQGWCTNKIYGQKYTVDGDSVAFDGERWSLFEELLTENELAELNNMRANYSLLEQFKLDTESAQLHSQRESILYDEKYSVLAEKDENNEYKNESYAKLVSEMDNYSLAELEKELKSVFADYITNGGQFAYTSEQEKPVVSKKLFTTSTAKKPGRYGNLFSK